MRRRVAGDNRTSVRFSRARLARLRRIGMMRGVDVQRQRARQYAVCSYALTHDRVTDGAEGVFDQALTNGLAAIVAAEWPGAEFRKNGTMHPASDLLKAIKARGVASDDDVVHVLRPGEPEWIAVTCDDDPFPNFTVVDVAALTDALRATQAIRHARDDGAGTEPGLTERHITALQTLAHHPALFGVTDEEIDRAEARVANADAIEAKRADVYLAALSDEERARRMAISYPDEYACTARDERCEVEDCPVCSSLALVARTFDGWLDEIGIGTCIVCSYRRSPDVAEELATERMLDRHIDD